MRRRDFLIAASMGAALPTASRAGADIAAADGAASTDILAVVYDPRYRAAWQFAQLHVERGACALSTDGCIVRLWRGPLASFVERKEPRIAGSTLYSDFAMARDCARERGLRVIQEDWCRNGPVTLVSWLIGT